MADRPGRIVLLNGTSSSGKTSLAHALQARLREPHLYVPIDAFQGMLPADWLGAGRHAAEGFEWRPQRDGTLTFRVGPVGDAIAHGMRRSLRALAETGNDLVADYPLLDPAWLRPLVEDLAHLDVLFVGVRCPLEVCVQRERLRGDRPRGLAAAQYDVVHAHGLYDLELDTSTASVAECARRVLELLRDPPVPSAFRRLALGLAAPAPSV